jgi:hypothetical protein
VPIVVLGAATGARWLFIVGVVELVESVALVGFEAVSHRPVGEVDD